MKIHEIPRASGVSRASFAEFMRGANHPLLIEGEVERWNASSLWSFEFFEANFPNYPIIACAPQFEEYAKYGVRTTLKQYLRYLYSPQSGIQGVWFKGDQESFQASGETLYAGNFNPAHFKYGNAELLRASVPIVPSFIDSWLNLLEPKFLQQCLRARSHHYVYLSAPGATTPAHYDFWDTHAFLAQIKGRKSVLMFSPQSINNLVDANVRANPFAFADSSSLRDVDAWSGTLDAGQLLIIPSRWVHYVETITASITYSSDWIDEANWRSYVMQAELALMRR